MCPKNNKSRLALLFFCIVYIGLFFWLGLYAWPQADDYLYFNATSEYGFWQVQLNFYLGWTGRFFNTFLICLASLLPLESAYWVFPIITILLYIASACFLMDTVAPEQPRIGKLLWALAMTSAMLAILPDLNETLYWRAGMPYFWTMAVLLLAFSLAIRGLRGSRLAFCLCFPLLVLNGTMLEQPCVFQSVIAFLSILLLLWKGDRKRALMCGALWLATLAGFLVLYLSPGTTARMGAITLVPFCSRLARALAVAVMFGCFTAIKFFIKPLVYVYLLFLPLIVEKIPAFDEKISSRVRAWHIILVTFSVAPLMEFISGWAQGTGLPLRAESLTIWMMGAVWALAWAFFYRGSLASPFSRFFAWRWPLLTLCLVISFNFIDVIRDMRIAPQFDAENYARMESIERQKMEGKEDIVIPAYEARPGALIYADLRPWVTDWKNGGYARYFRVRSVAVLPKTLCGDPEAQKKIALGDVEPFVDIANRGDKEMQFLMGELYDPNFAAMKGVDKNPEKAIEWYRRTALDGNDQSCRRLTRIYAKRGRDFNDYLSALGWFIRFELLSLRL